MPDLPDLSDAYAIASDAVQDAAYTHIRSRPFGHYADAVGRDVADRLAPLVGAAYLEDLAAAIDAERERIRYHDDLGTAVRNTFGRAAGLARGVAAHCRATAARPATDRGPEPRADADTGTNRNPNP